MEDNKAAEEPPVVVEGEEKPKDEPEEVPAPVAKAELQIPRPRDLSYF